MKPQKQLFRHRPQDGIYGDCHRTAIAVVLDLEAADVPHFMDGASDKTADDAHDRAEAWLNERGISTINVLFPGETAIETILSTIADCNPRGRPGFLLLGRSRNGTNHFVACCDGKVVCDPSQDDSGIVGPCDDGYYWVTFFGNLDATADPFRRNAPAAAAARERLEQAAAALARILTVRGCERERFSIALGTGELHAHATCPELSWFFPKPSKVEGVPVEWHWGNVAGLAEQVA